ncbi:MAG: hypothetical protein HGA87_01590 [Desulfobulbaceae bacterium]|nr:hypothetical protein [Desulfobulbaceae bacterium]
MSEIKILKSACLSVTTEDLRSYGAIFAVQDIPYRDETIGTYFFDRYDRLSRSEIKNAAGDLADVLESEPDISVDDLVEEISIIFERHGV